MTARLSPSYSSLSKSSLHRISSLSALTRASQNSDDTLATAKLIGSLSASSSAVSFKAKGKLSRTDRSDFVKLSILPGAAYSSIADLVTVKGAGIKLTTFFEIPGSSPQQAGTIRYNPGTSSEVTNSPFANTFGVPIQLYFQVNSLRPSKKVSYNVKVTFNP